MHYTSAGRAWRGTVWLRSLVAFAACFCLLTMASNAEAHPGDPIILRVDGIVLPVPAVRGAMLVDQNPGALPPITIRGRNFGQQRGDVHVTANGFAVVNITDWANDHITFVLQSTTDFPTAGSLAITRSDGKAISYGVDLVPSINGRQIQQPAPQPVVERVQRVVVFNDPTRATSIVRETTQVRPSPTAGSVTRITDVQVRYDPRTGAVLATRVLRRY